MYSATKQIKLSSKKSYTLTVGDNVKLTAKVVNPKSGAMPISWSSSNKDVANVDS